MAIFFKDFAFHIAEKEYYIFHTKTLHPSLKEILDIGLNC